MLHFLCEITYIHTCIHTLTVCGVFSRLSTFSKYTLMAPESVISSRHAAIPTRKSTIPIPSFMSSDAGLFSFVMSTAPSTMRMSALHLRMCRFLFIMSTLKMAVVRIFACAVVQARTKTINASKKKRMYTSCVHLPNFLFH